jgi:membrane protein implicated in regulation of membrane protease activity
MGPSVLWWHWVAFGIVLSIFEIFVPSFTIIWFGIGAVLTGVVVAVFPVGFGGQILLWSLFSGLMTAVWFFWIHPKVGSKPDEIPPEWKDRNGVVTKAGGGMEKGRIRFQSPLLGDTEWPFVSDEELKEGETAVVCGVEGQLLRVRKASA